MKKLIAVILSVTLALSVTSCGRQNQGEKEKWMTTQKEVGRISRYESIVPKEYKWFDYGETALAFDALLFEATKEGTYLPLLWQDKKNDTFAFAAYVGDGRFGQDGSQEAVATIASLLSATLVGVDKSSQNGVNYVEQLHAYFSETEGVVLNNPGGASAGTSMWYMLYPAILFSKVSLYYPEETLIREDTLACIDKWYEAGMIMKETGTFNYTGFDFLSMTPWENGIWKEPDCAAGIAVLMETGVSLTGNEKYERLLQDCLVYHSEFEGSPLYEVLSYFAPGLAAKSNAQKGTAYDIDDMLGDVFNGSSIPRGGWGEINGTWGEYCVNGLMGSTTDGGGYAFAMNTFAGGYALASLAKYDTRYAQAMGIYFLNAAAAGRYFFPGETEKENQSAAGNEDTEDFLKAAGNAVPYEGIRKSSNTKTPWVGGDPTVYGWAETDLSLYSGSHTGMFAAAVEKTNVDKLLKIDCNLDNPDEGFATYLLYNPYDSAKTVTYVLPEGNWDLFDSVEKQVLAENVNGEWKLTLEGGQALVLVEIPGGSAIVHENGVYKVMDRWIAADTVTVLVSGYEKNARVSGTVKLDISVTATDETAVLEQIILEIEDEKIVFDGKTEVSFKTTDYSEGSKNVKVTAKMSDGKWDTAVLRLNFKH